MPLTVAQLRNLRDAIDAELATVYAAIKAKQNAFFATHGRYRHIPRTCQAFPVDGATAANDRLTFVPPNEAGSASDWGIDLSGRKFALQVDRYETGAGEFGWVATVWIRVNGDVWTRSKGEGPENRDSAWAKQ